LCKRNIRTLEIREYQPKIGSSSFGSSLIKEPPQARLGPTWQ